MFMRRFKIQDSRFGEGEWKDYLIDKALAIDSVLFMVSALLSFSSIRAVQYSGGLERWAEIIFLCGLVSMTIITVLFSFEIA